MLPSDDELRWWAAQETRFVLLHPHQKKPCHTRWPDRRIGVEQACAHVARGGNVGVLLGRASHGLFCLDVDRYFPLLVRLLPDLCGLRVVRGDAPERGKLFFRLAEPDSPLTNRRYRLPGERRPIFELLGEHKQAVIPPSVHPNGTPYARMGDTLPVLSRTDLDTLWDLLTAAPLAARHEEYQRAGRAGRGTCPAISRGAATCSSVSIEAWKAQWPSALAVFRHFGRAALVEAEASGDLRLLDNGGLLVGRPDSAHAWRWYCFSDEIGGDQLDAAGYCLFGMRWNRRDATQFRDVLRVLAS